MSEYLLHYIWLHRLYAHHLPLYTTDRQALLIHHPGFLNQHAGPDFPEARLRIGSTLWAGPVELHVRSSDWMKHGHDDDARYERIILHVVYEHDVDIPSLIKRHTPTLELKAYIPDMLLQRLQHWMTEQAFIPCHATFHKASRLIKLQQTERMLHERLHEQAARIEQQWLQCGHHWEDVFYRQLARSFGLPLNADAFEQLAARTPYHMLCKHRYHPFRIEAFLLGQAGFLEESSEHPYLQQLQQEYQLWQQVYAWQPMQVTAWKFLRLRPAHFPTLRLAQLAAILQQYQHLTRDWLEASDWQSILSQLQPELPDFWHTHYTLHTDAAVSKKLTGLSFRYSVLINAVIPYMFFYGRQQQQPALMEKALHWLETLPAEQNHIIRAWKQVGMRPQAASGTQALLHLHRHYCSRHRCLECSIGYALLKTPGGDNKEDEKI